MIAVQVSLYPLETDKIEKNLKIFWKELEKQKIKYKITPLSTIVWTEEETGSAETDIYLAVFNAYKKVRITCRAVMVTTTTTGSRTEINKLLEFL